MGEDFLEGGGDGGVVGWDADGGCGLLDELAPPVFLCGFAVGVWVENGVWCGEEGVSKGGFPGGGGDVEVVFGEVGGVDF